MIAFANANKKKEEKENIVYLYLPLCLLDFVKLHMKMGQNFWFIANLGIRIWIHIQKPFRMVVHVCACVLSVVARRRYRCHNALSIYYT